MELSIIYNLLLAMAVAIAVLIFLVIYLIIKLSGTNKTISAELQKFIDDKFRDSKKDQFRISQYNNEEQRKSIKFITQQIGDKLNDFISNQNDKLTNVNNSIESLEKAVQTGLKELNEENSKQLEVMRQTVDEKLSATLEKRLGETFKLVSERLEEVHKGIGEMQNLATGVGDLKNVLTNVKTRGTWGEIQLKAIMEQLLIPSQYMYNAEIVPGSMKRVEAAIVLPGSAGTDKVLLPIDSKFPIEDYNRIIDDMNASKTDTQKQQKALETRIKLEAKSISTKYIQPPHTTDFAIMFLPVEGLFAEVLRIPGLYEVLLNDYRIVIAGPTNFAAILNSLQLGFRTLAIEKRTAEVWKLLSSLKNEFWKFGDMLEKTRIKLDQASKTISDASNKSQKIYNSIENVEQLKEN